MTKSSEQWALNWGNEMKIIRRPRPKPPTDIAYKDVRKATKNGVVDLSKVRDAREKRKQERIKRAASARKVLDQKRRIARHFVDLYKEIVGGKYDLRPIRYRNRPVKGKKNVIRRAQINSDVERLWAVFYYVKSRYGEGVEAYREYIERMLNEIMENEIVKKAGIVGYIENKDRIDDFFISKKKRSFVAKKAGNVRRRSEAYSEYFDDE